MEASLSIEPPKTESKGRGMPGMVIPLAFVSFILLGAVLVFGALAFDVGIPGLTDSDEVEFAAPEEVLEAAGFTMRERTTDGETTLVDVEVTILNTSEHPVEEFQVMVQCTDNGYVSAILTVGAMEPDESRTVSIQLAGRGEPSCHEPVIDFSDPRPGN
jgi:hypothetical protein